MTAAALLAAWQDFARARSRSGCSNGFTDGGRFYSFTPERDLKNGVMRVRCYLDGQDMGQAEFTAEGTLAKVPPVFHAVGFPADAFTYCSLLTLRAARLNAAFTTEDVEP